MPFRQGPVSRNRTLILGSQGHVSVGKRALKVWLLGNRTFKVLFFRIKENFNVLTLFA
jgi:hypothetical protein